MLFFLFLFVSFTSASASASASVVVSTSLPQRRNSDDNITVAPTKPPSRRKRPPLSPISLHEQKLSQQAQLMMISNDPDIETAGEQLSELMLNASPSTAKLCRCILKDTIANELPTTIAKKWLFGSCQGHILLFYQIIRRRETSHQK